jgi:hypothetical protein
MYAKKGADPVVFPQLYGHTAKRVIFNPEVSNENQERREPPISPQKIYSTV